MWFRKKMIIRRSSSPTDLPPGFRWMGKRYLRIFFLSFILMLGMLTFIDALLRDAGFRGDNIELFNSGIIGLFLTIWFVLYYLKPDWFKNSSFGLLSIIINQKEF